MKKLFSLFALVLFASVLFSCSGDVEVPKVESLGYDITPVTSILNDHLNQEIINDLEFSVIEDELNTYLMNFSVMNNAYELISIDYYLRFAISYARDAYETGYNLTLIISFTDLVMNEDTYDQVEMVFLQMRQDLDDQTDYPIYLNTSFSFNRNRASFSSITGIDNDTDGFMKQVHIRTDMSKNDPTHALLDHTLTQEFAKYYQKSVIVIMTFSDGSFFMKFMPEREEYAIDGEDSMAADDYMSEYIKGYKEVDFEY